MEKIVESSIVSISIFISINENKLISNLNDLIPLKIELMKDVQAIIGEYLFYKGKPYFETVSMKSTNPLTEGQLFYCLQGEIDVGDCIEDEWMIAFTLYSLSKKHPNYIIHIIDGDGYFLLIEAAKELPNWMDPITMENRFFIQNGHFIVVPHPSYSSYKTLPCSPTIEDSIHAILKKQIEIFPSIEEAILSRFNEMQPIFHHNYHLCNCLLPASWSNLLQSSSFLTTFAQIYLHATDMEKQQANKARESLHMTNNVVNYVIKLPRLLFIQLITMPVESSTSHVSGIDYYTSLSPRERASLLGERIHIGALLFQPPQTHKRFSPDDGVSSSSLSSSLLFALTNNYSYKEYCQLEESQIPSLLGKEGERTTQELIQEDLEWMVIEEDDMNHFLQTEEGNLREEDINSVIEEDRMGQEVLQSFKSFLSGISNVEGVDSIPSGKNEENHTPIHVDFDKVMGLLKGVHYEEPINESYEEPEPDLEEEYGEDPFADEDLDMQVLTNLLQSYTNQPTVDGPVQNIMLSMGKSLPSINEDDLDCYCLLL